MATVQAAKRPGAVDTVEGDRVVRFDVVERAVHWATAVLVLVLMATGAVLYVSALAVWVGNRALVKDVHVWSGVLLPLPLALGLAGSWRRGLARDAGRLGRWTGHDRAWLRSRGRSSSVRLGKFNAGQKLNALFLAGTLPTLVLTGLVMRWFAPFPDSWRTGATFAHDVAALGVCIAVIGHVVKALGEPVALRSMITGRMPRAWVDLHHPRWAESIDD